MKMYAVIEFEIDTPVKVAPVNCLRKNNRECLYGPSQKLDRRQRVVKAKEDLQPDWVCEEFAVLVLYKTGEMEMSGFF